VIPERIDLVAINIKPTFDFSSELSPEVEKAIPKAICEVEKLIA
jgi:Ni,Fe-hydrogenase maturation factor